MQTISLNAVFAVSLPSTKTEALGTYDNLVLCAVTLNNKTSKSRPAISQAAKPAIINSFFSQLKCETDKTVKYFVTVHHEAHEEHEDRA